MRKLLVLGAGILQLPGIIKAKEMGLYVITFDYNPEAIGFKYADESYVISTIDIEAATKKAVELKPDGVITLASDMPMRTIASIGATLGLPTIDMETSINATDKGAMRRALKKGNVPIPDFFEIKSKDELLKAAEYFCNKGMRFIVKPADNAASRGVTLCDKNTDMLKVFDYTRNFSRQGGIMVEEYMEGPEVSVETIAVDGKVNIIAITDKITTGAPHFTEIGHSQPSMLPASTREKIKEVAAAANKAIGIKNGPSHTEIIVTKEGPKIVELGARLGGDNINTHLVPLSTGVSIVGAVISCALGEAPDITPTLNKGAAIRFFEGKNGVLKSITGIEDAKNTKGVIQVDTFKTAGDSVKTIQSSDDRLGCIIAQADSAEEALEICSNAGNLINFEIE